MEVPNYIEYLIFLKGKQLHCNTPTEFGQYFYPRKRMNKSTMNLQIIHDYKLFPSAEKELTALAKSIYRREKISSIQKTLLVLCSDYKIRKLNSQYRKKDRATDVLSFPFGDSDFLGEIYISLQRAKVQANRYGFSYNEELARLFVHGMFHLLGYDHHKEQERLAMEAKEHQYVGHWE